MNLLHKTIQLILSSTILTTNVIVNSLFALGIWHTRSTAHRNSLRKTHFEKVLIIQSAVDILTALSMFLRVYYNEAAPASVFYNTACSLSGIIVLLVTAQRYIHVLGRDLRKVYRYTIYLICLVDSVLYTCSELYKNLRKYSSVNVNKELVLLTRVTGFVSVGISLVIVVTLNIGLWKFSKNTAQQIAASRSNSYEKQLSITLVCVSFVYILIWLPGVVGSMVSLIENIDRLVFSYYTILVCSTGFLNALIYMTRVTKLKRFYLGLFTQRQPDQTTQRGGETPIAQTQL